MLYIQRLAEDGDDVDIAELENLEVELKDKIDGIIHIVGVLGQRSQTIKDEIKRLQAMLKTNENKVRKLKDYAAFEMNRSGVTSLKTRFHSVACVQNQPSAIYDEYAELDDIDPRCIVVVPEQHKVSKEKALQVYKQTGEIPKGFHIESSGFHIKVR